MILEYWKEMSYVVVAVISVIGSYIFGGRQKQKTDAITSMQLMYEGFLEHFKTQMDGYSFEIKELKTSNAELQKNFNDLQSRFNDLWISYSHELQKNADWARMYNELKAKYQVLEAQYDKLKKDFEAHKRKTS